MWLGSCGLSLNQSLRPVEGDSLTQPGGRYLVLERDFKEGQINS